MTALRVTAKPDQGQYRPGRPVRLTIAIAGTPGAEVSLDLRLTQLATTIRTWTSAVRLDPSGSATSIEHLDVPDSGAHWEAFGVDVEAFVVDISGDESATTSTAFDVTAHWEVAPRYGFLSEFGPTPEHSDDDAALDVMAELHLSCIQFYDWMYRHHAYVPPVEQFTDVLGRAIDFARVRRRITGCTQRGMAPIAYASVYGAERPFSEDHPEWLLYDLAGRPLSLAEVFYIQDPSPDSGWRKHLLSEYQAALDLGFVGLHCDTYGSPKAGVAHRDGAQTHVRLETVLPDLVAESDALAREAHSQGGAMLNCVSGWPLEQVAQTTSATFYIEVWPPHSTYRDLHELVVRAHRLDRERQVILAAYLPFFHPESDEDPDHASQGLRLTSAAIFASGGFHLLPGEGHAVLADSYYPHYGHLGDDAWNVVRAYWNFQTRYGPLLADRRAADVSSSYSAGPAREVVLDGVVQSPMAEPGTVWTIVKEAAGRTVVHLINLTEVTDTRWTIAQSPVTALTDLPVQIEATRPVRTVWTATPDGDEAPRHLQYQIVETDDAAALTTHVPRLNTWTILVVEWFDVE